MPKSVHRVIQVTSDSIGTSRSTLYDSKKKHAKRLKPLEKFMRRHSRARLISTQDYLDRHDRSNRKKKNGWLRDYLSNTLKSNRKGLKKLL
jgi:predicted transcriptional regulator of viral defense system